MKKTATMTLDNYFKRQTKLENEARVQNVAAQTDFTNLEETVHDALQNAWKKQQLLTKNKTK